MNDTVLTLLILFIGIPLAYALVINFPKFIGAILSRLGLRSSAHVENYDRRDINKHLEEQERTSLKAASAHLEQGRL